MKFSLNLMNCDFLGDARVLTEVAVEAEQSGWDAVFLWDHVNWTGMGFHVDPWIVLGLIAERTSQVLIGTAITPLARRRPTKLAREILTLHQLSNGRFVLGAGSGAWASEFEDLGDPADLRTRAQMLDEGLELLRKTWSGDDFDHEGVYYKAKGQTFYPGGTEIPIWLGATWPNRRPFRRAARYDGVMAMNQDYRNPLAVADVEAISRYLASHRSGERPFNLAVALNSSDDRVADRDRADAYEAAGASWWQEGVFPPPVSLDALQTTVRRGPPRK